MKDEKQTFDEVQKALALKRHEQPPAPFFNRFSDKVLDRLHGPQPEEPSNWCQRLGLGDDPKPVLLCLLGLVVCAGLAVGLIVALNVEKPPETIATQAGDPSAAVAEPVLNGVAEGASPGLELLPSQDGQPGISMPVLVPMENTEDTPRP